MLKYFVIAACFFCSTTFASDKELPTALLIAAPEIPPLVYFNEQEQLVGSLVDKLNAFSRKTGIKVTIDVMTWARALAQVKHGKHDALMPTIKTTERTHFLTFPKLALVNFQSSVLIQRNASQPAAQSLASLTAGKSIAKARSMILGNKIDKLLLNEKNNVVEVNSVEAAMKMLELGRVDFVATDKGIAMSVIKKLSLKSDFTFIEMTNEPSESSASYLAFSQRFSAKYDVEKLMSQFIKAINTVD